MIKKIILLIFCISLVSCKTNTSKEDNNKVEYNNYKKILEENTGKNSSNLLFDVSIKLRKIKEKYFYNIIINDPKVAMKNVKIMVINSKAPKDLALTVGILNNEIVSLIPFQSDKDNGVIKGISLNGESKTNTFDLNMLITFDDDENTKKYKYFVNFKINNGKIVGEINE